MASKQTPAQTKTVDRVMHEFKHGELESSSGDKVKNPKQAIAIALHEAGASNQESPAKNRSNLRKTKARERAGRTAMQVKEGAGAKTRSELYEEARSRDVAGRSKCRRPSWKRALA